MKKEWIKPVVKYVMLDEKDIVCTSPNCGDNYHENDQQPNNTTSAFSLWSSDGDNLSNGNF